MSLVKDTQKVHYMSDSVEWSTPQYLFDALDAEFRFNLDVCATHDNTKCEKYYTKEEDGLARDWSGFRCWMNPPYGREIGKWIKKASESVKHGGGVVVCLVPARTDTAYWHQYAMQATEIRLISKRVKFGDSNQGAPFPSAILIFGTPRVPVIRSWSVDE